MKPFVPTRRSRGTACVLLTCLTVPGCGFVFAHGPPDGHARMESFSCTESYTAPLVDVLSLGLVGLVVATGDHSGLDRTRVIVTTGVVAGALGSSAYVGFDRASSCRAAVRALVERQEEARRSRRPDG